MKTCKRCMQEKEITDFYKNKGMSDGRLSVCILCKKEDAKKYRIENIEKCREARRKYKPDPKKRAEALRRYGKSEKGKLARARYASSEKYKEVVKRHSNTSGFKLGRARANNKYANKNPTKIAAHKAVRHAIKNGNLNRLPCQICGDLNSHAHHDDYAKKLDVRWLCALHHQLWHAENGEGLNGDAALSGSKITHRMPNAFKRQKVD